MISKTFLLCIGPLWLASTLHAQGTFVTNGATLIYEGTLERGPDVRVSQNPANTDYTGFNLRPEGGNSFLFNPLLDQQVRTFLVDLNDTISLQAIQSGSYTELLFPNTYTFNRSTPFYLGFYTGQNYPVEGVYADPLFGWAKLVNQGGTIQLLDSALVYGAAGIYAGTTTLIPIPEPTTATLAGLGIFALTVRSRRAPAQSSLPKRS